jgi:hypothetical protein
MKSKNADYGWDIEMTYLRAIRVVWWRLRHETWRSIAFLWIYYYPDEENRDLDSNQYYGMSVLDCAATKLGFSSYVSWRLN